MPNEAGGCRVPLDPGRFTISRSCALPSAGEKSRAFNSSHFGLGYKTVLAGNVIQHSHQTSPNWPKTAPELPSFTRNSVIKCNDLVLFPPGNLSNGPAISLSAGAVDRGCFFITTFDSSLSPLSLLPTTQTRITAAAIYTLRARVRDSHVLRSLQSLFKLFYSPPHSFF